MLTPEQIKRYYIRDTSIEAKADTQRRPLEKGIGGITMGKDSRNTKSLLSRAEQRKLRFPEGVMGYHISADLIGGYSPKGYGGISQVFLFCDLGNTGGYLYPLFYTEGIKDVTAKAMRQACLHWDRWGHMRKDWSTTFQADSGSFSSTATEEVTDEFKIKSMFSAPERQAQNPIESHIKPLFRTVTKMFAAAEWVPRPFWTYAISYACKANNKSIHPNETIPPDEQFMNERSDFVAHPILPWGQPIEVMIHPKKVSWKFGWKTVTGIYLDTPANIKGAIIYFNMTTKKVRIGYTFKMLDYMPLPNWPVYKGDKKDYSEKIFAEAVRPDPEDDDDDRTLMGGDPNQLPKGFLEDAVFIKDDLILDPITVQTENDPSLITMTNNGPGSDEADTFTSSQQPAASSFEEVEPDSGPITEWLTPITGSSELHHSLVPNETVDDNSYNLEDVTPHTLAFDRIFITSLDENNQLQPGAEFAYRLSAEEVETPSEYNSDNDSKPESDSKSDSTDLPSKNNRQRLRDAIRAKQGERTRRPRAINKILRKVNDGVSGKNITKSINSLTQKINTKAKKKVRTDDNPSLAKAMAGPYRHLVKEAIEKELTQFVETYLALKIFSEEEKNSIPMEKLRNALSSHYEIKYKRDKNTGALTEVKARLCIHGNETDKYSFDDIKSPTARTACIKLILSLMAKTINGKSFTARSYDVTGAFLQTRIDERTQVKRTYDPTLLEPEEILIRLPDGRIGVLLCYAYGLKQASVEFYNSVDEMMKANEFLNSVDPCIYVKELNNGDLIIVGVHVDDFLAISTSTKLLDEFTDMMRDRFDDTTKSYSEEDQDLQFLGCNIHRCENGDVFVTQAGYIKQLWKRYSTKFDLKAETFYENKQPLFPRHASTTPNADDNEPVDSTDYRGIVGALNYLALMTRPEISEAMSAVASKCNAPTKADLKIVKHIFRYVMHTAHLGLCFKADGDIQLYVWADASFASQLKMHSQSGYCFSLGRFNAVFFAKSQKQHLVTISSTEAEYIALFHSVTEIIYLTRLLAHMGFEQGPVIIFQDNISTMHWAERQQNFHRVKHMAVKYNFVQEKVEDHTVVLEYLPTEDMIADILTKPVVSDLFEKLACQMLGVASFEVRSEGYDFYEFKLLE